MRPLDLFAIVRRVANSIPPSINQYIFGYGFRQHEGRMEGPEGGRLVAEFARWQVALHQIPHIELVLTAFKLDTLLDFKFAASLMDLSGKADEKTYAFVQAWRVFTGFVDPVEALTIPIDLRGGNVPDDDLSIDLPDDEREMTVGRMISLLKSAEQLYAGVAQAYEIDADLIPLEISYLSTGTSVRIDLKGTGEIVKEVRKLLVSGWNIVRHRKAHDLSQKSVAFLDALDVVKKIDEQIRSGALTEEEGAKLKQKILHSAQELFKGGALPTSIPAIETVENHQLLSEVTGVRAALPPGKNEQNAASYHSNHAAEPERKTRHKLDKGKRDSSGPSSGSSRGASKRRSSADLDSDGASRGGN